MQELLAQAYALRHENPAEMVRQCELARVAAARCGSLETVGLAAAFLGNAYRVVGRVAEARDAFDQAEEILPQCSPAPATRIMELIANFHLHKGEAEAAAALFQRAIQMRLSSRLEDGLAVSLVKLAESLTELGRHAEALRSISQAIALIPQTDRLLKLTAMNNGAAILCAAGDPESALASIDRLALMYQRHAPTGLLASREHILAHAREALGDNVLAENHYRRAMDLYNSIGLLPKVAAVRLELSSLLAAGSS